MYDSLLACIGGSTRGVNACRLSKGGLSAATRALLQEKKPLTSRSAVGLAVPSTKLALPEPEEVFEAMDTPMRRAKRPCPTDRQLPAAHQESAQQGQSTPPPAPKVDDKLDSMSPLTPSTPQFASSWQPATVELQVLYGGATTTSTDDTQDTETAPQTGRSVRRPTRSQTRSTAAVSPLSPRNPRGMHVPITPAAAVAVSARTGQKKVYGTPPGDRAMNTPSPIMCRTTTAKKSRGHRSTTAHASQAEAEATAQPPSPSSPSATGGQEGATTAYDSDEDMLPATPELPRGLRAKIAPPTPAAVLNPPLTPKGQRTVQIEAVTEEEFNTIPSYLQKSPGWQQFCTLLRDLNGTCNGPAVIVSGDRAASEDAVLLFAEARGWLGMRKHSNSNSLVAHCSWC